MPIMHTIIESCSWTDAVASYPWNTSFLIRRARLHVHPQISKRDVNMCVTSGGLTLHGPPGHHVRPSTAFERGHCPMPIYRWRPRSLGVMAEDVLKLREFLGRAAAKARDLDRMRISSPLQAEILALLTNGRRTMSEMTEEIYGVHRPDSSYHTYYMKVSRAVKALQRRGYIITGLFGRDKPYRLTPFALAKMTDIGEDKPRVLPIHDAFVYVSTVTMGLVNTAYASESPFLSRPETILIYTAFVFLAGYSLARLGQAFRRVG